MFRKCIFIYMPLFNISVLLLTNFRAMLVYNVMSHQKIIFKWKKKKKTKQTSEKMNCVLFRNVCNIISVEKKIFFIFFFYFIFLFIYFLKKE